MCADMGKVQQGNGFARSDGADCWDAGYAGAPVDGKGDEINNKSTVSH